MCERKQLQRGPGQLRHPESRKRPAVAQVNSLPSVCQLMIPKLDLHAKSPLRPLIMCQGLGRHADFGIGGAPCSWLTANYTMQELVNNTAPQQTSHVRCAVKEAPPASGSTSEEDTHLETTDGSPDAFSQTLLNFKTQIRRQEKIFETEKKTRIKTSGTVAHYHYKCARPMFPWTPCCCCCCCRKWQASS